MKNFESLGLNENTLKATKELGFINPTEIQEQAIPAILETDKNLIGLAQTGTGKTAAFGLPLLQKIDFYDSNVQALILSPTRELALQIEKDLQNFAKFIHSVGITVVYGGSPIEKQIKKLKGKIQIVVGTPGRTLDLIKRKKLNIKQLSWLILDEADEMLNMGFRDDLDAILKDTPENKRTLLFSATMPNEVRTMSSKYLDNPIEITVGKKNSGAKNVEHNYYVVRKNDKYQVLKRIVDFEPDIYSIVFCRTRMETKEIAEKLMQDGYDADALHGDLSQAQRDFVMKKFRNRSLKILVATDVAARGLDISDLTHIINYNIPDDLEAYIHRSGRTGRAGKNGISIVFASPSESRKIKELEKLTNKKFVKQQVPSGEDIANTRIYNYLNKIKDAEIEQELIQPFKDYINSELAELSKEEIIKKIITLELHKILDYYNNSQDIATKEFDNDNRRSSRDRKTSSRENFGRGRRNGTKFEKLYINLGTKQNINPARLMGLINESTDTNNIEIGKIEIQKNLSFFEIDKEFYKMVSDSLSQMSFNGKSIVSAKADVKKETYKRDSYKKNSFKKDFKRKTYNHRRKVKQI